MSKFGVILFYFCYALPLFTCQKFGLNNFYNCHCEFDSACDQTTGQCPGNCQRGWSGTSCQKQNVALDKTASVISTINNGLASLVVDGNRANFVTSSFDQKCTDTGFETDPWWRVDLGQTYPIRDINIVYRDQYVARLYGFRIDVGLTTENGANTLCYQHNNITTISYNYDVQCYNNIYGQYVTITVPRYVFMVLCEVEVYVCSVGTYGNNCDNFCHCVNNARCDYVSGNCPVVAGSRCQAGWTGDSCNQACSFPNYGPSCTSDCNNRQCQGSQDCNPVTGRCMEGCKPGYREVDCSQKCTAGTYGDGCGLVCNNRQCQGSQDCNHVTGQCTGGCNPGYREVDCSQRCTTGKYGPSCGSYCNSRQCKFISQGCNHITGECIGGCKPGYIGINCLQICVDSYGPSCASKCSDRHCTGIQRCNHVTGLCVGGCVSQYGGYDCTQVCNKGYGKYCQFKCADRKCSGNQDCDRTTGKCTEGCLSGYIGDDCTQACTGRYGLNCGLECSSRHCKGSQDCNQETGKCIDGCRPGYQGEDCTQICYRRYGQDCSQNCSNRNCHGNQNCNHVTGSCIDGCSPGYQGDDCTQKCQNRYGEKCGYDCKSRNCSGNQECYHVTGRCTEGCTAGYNSDDCTQECDNGYYGNNCNLVCSQRFCLNDQASCSNIDGSCGGDCQTDYEGGDCTVKKGATTEDNTVVIASTVSVFVILIIIIIILIIIILRRRRPLQREMPTVQFVQGKPPMYENAAFIQHLTEASNSRITESSESDYAQLDLGDNLQTLYCNLPLTKSETELKELNDFIVKTKVENEIDGFASFKEIPGCNQPKSYIAAQESTDVTTTDFIKLIWKRKFDKVIMVTRKHEIAEIRYWPEMGTETFGDFKLTLIQEKTRADFTVRVVSIQKDNNKHQFHQFHYTSWPGHGVPDTHDLLDFIFTVNKVNPKSTTPQLIHCLTGVEITGTYIAIDICLKTWKSKGEAGVISCLKKMKDKRRGMIQTASQLKFVYDVLLEGITRGDTSLNKDVFEANYDKQGYNFEMGNMTSPGHFQFLKSIQTGTDNISKVYNSYTHHNGYYFESLTELDTMWKTIHDRQSSIVVFIIDDNTDQTDLYPGIGSTEVYNDIKVKTISQENLSDKITRMSVSATQKESHTDLLVFTLKIQKSEAKTFTYLTQTAVELLQHLTVDEHNDKPITMFTCNLQYVRVICILRNIIQRLLLEGEVEIVQNVRKMHQRIEQTIFTEEEFMVLYQVISEYIKSTNVYDYVK